MQGDPFCSLEDQRGATTCTLLFPSFFPRASVVSRNLYAITVPSLFYVQKYEELGIQYAYDNRKTRSVVGWELGPAARTCTMM